MIDNIEGAKNGNQDAVLNIAEHGTRSPTIKLHLKPEQSHQSRDANGGHYVSMLNGPALSLCNFILRCMYYVYPNYRAP